MSGHTYYYKILDAAPEEPLPATLPLSDLDTKDGFIHLSVSRHHVQKLFSDPLLSSHPVRLLSKLLSLPIYSSASAQSCGS